MCPPASNSTVLSRATEVLTRLTSLPGTTATSTATQVRRRSRSQAAPAASSPAPAAAAAPARRQRSVSQAASAVRRAAPVVQQQLPTPPAAQKARQKPPGKRAAAAARRRSRTQVIQNSVRRLSDPRRPRSGQQQQRPPSAAAPPPPPAACPVPRTNLEFSGRRREQVSPRATQLVTCDRLHEPLSARPGSAAALAAQRRRGAVTSVTSLPATGGAARPGPGTASVTSLQAQHSPGQQQAEQPAAVSAAATAPAESHDAAAPEGGHPVTTSQFISTSLDKLEKIRRASEDAVRRINSLSMAPTAAEPGAATVEEVQMKQTGKVKWVAMPTQPPHPPPSFSNTRLPTPAGRPLTPAPRAAVSPPRAASPAVSPRLAAPALRPGSDQAAPTAGGARLLPVLSPPPPGHPPAFNTRITELKTLIDRAIEETREFLGRSRPVARPVAAPQPAEQASVTASPRPCLSPTIVDIAVRRPTAGSSVWERAAAELVDAQRPGSARSGPRRGSPAAAMAVARPEQARLTELVGLQGRRFLPQLGPPEPPPRRSR
ncbi:hypothetical protein FJT64_027684 [Amphibalanus amphitrite]|uniref:Uncharacterized protein n=1 Tax=Amphibalanus amphitrite TaxID=1232801 RepID=A0A6A4VUA9_AMPAM|nr:hypothetical protein FJT64_027684 [Amphibalanus amphitrite]